METAATKARNFSSFLLMAQLQAREIGARIALARNEAGLTQEELCDLATFSKRSLQNWEAGANIPYRHMQEVSGLLGRPVEWFLHGEQPGGDDSESPVELRLSELADAVRVLTRQVQQGSEDVAARLLAIERQLQPTNASARPKGAGRRETGTPRRSA